MKISRGILVHFYIPRKVAMVSYWASVAHVLIGRGSFIVRYSSKTDSFQFETTARQSSLSPCAMRTCHY